MKNLFLDDIKFNHFKKDWISWLDKGMPGCDEKIKDLLIKLNTLNGVTTRFSCEGHIEEGSESSFYICTVYTEVGLTNLLNLYNNIIEKIPKQEDLRYRLDLEISQLIPYNSDLEDDFESIPCLTFRLYPEEEEKETLIKTMLSVAEEVIEPTAHQKAIQSNIDLILSMSEEYLIEHW